MEYIFLTISIVFFALLAFALYKIFKKKPNIKEIISNRVILKIEVPRRNEKTPLAAEQMFASLHGILRNAVIGENHFSFEIASGNYGIFFIVTIDRAFQNFLEGQIYAQYPDANISEVKDYAANTLSRNPEYVLSTELTLEKDYFLPIKTFNNFAVDPLASITAAVAGITGNDQVWIQILVRPVSNFWQKLGKDFVTHRKNAKSTYTENGVTKTAPIPLEAGEQEELTLIETKSKKLGFIVEIRIIALGPDKERIENKLHDVISSFKQFQTGHLNSFVQKKDKRSIFIKILDAFVALFEMITMQKEVELTDLQKYTERYMSVDDEDILNVEELASVFHLPNVSVETPTIAWASARRLQYPLNLPVKEDTERVRFFAQTAYHNTSIPFGIKKEDRRRHMYIIGKTGTGKSSLMKNMIISDILDGEGVCLIDPHGQDIEDILEYIPPHRIKDVVYVDPSDLNFPIGFNLLELKNDEQRDLVADGVVEVFKKHFGDSWGPRLQYILHNTILTLLFAQNTTLLGVQRILRDKNYRKFILKQVKDPILLKFWNEEYEEMQKNPKLATEAVAPIQNKIGRFLSSAMIRNMVGQVKSTIDLEDIMNGRKILLINLSQGRIGEENSALLGGMLITRIQATAMQRVHIPEFQRSDFYLYVDEFQNFATSAFAKILSEARKYRLNLIVAHQYIAQLTDDVKNSVFGNVGSIMTFVVGPQDGASMQKEFAPFVTQDDLVSLEKYHVIMKLMINGEQSQPFTAVTLPNYNQRFGIKNEVIRQSREMYAKDKVMVEDKIERWSDGVYNGQGNLMQKTELENMQKQKSGDISPRIPMLNKQTNQQTSQPRNQPPHEFTNPQVNTTAVLETEIMAKDLLSEIQLPLIKNEELRIKSYGDKNSTQQTDKLNNQRINQQRNPVKQEQNNRQTNKPSNQLTNKPSNQTTNKPANQQTNEPTNHQTNPPKRKRNRNRGKKKPDLELKYDHKSHFDKKKGGNDGESVDQILHENKDNLIIND